jgi:granule-bound starch synthase
MKIVFVSTEVAPWSKTGGLGDVVGSLPIELAKRGHKVMTISPRYDQYKGAWDTSVKVDALGKQVGYFHEHKKGVDRVFVDHPLFLAKVWGKTGSKLYGKTNGADFADNQERFAMFCKAALEAPMVLPFGYGEDVCFVANDWHSGLVPVMINKVYRPNGASRSTRDVALLS